MRDKLKTVIVDSFHQMKLEGIQKNCREQDELNLVSWEREETLDQFLAREKLDAEECLLLSGNPSHLQEAKVRGMARVGVLTPGIDEFLPGADTVVENIEDLDSDFFEKSYQREHGIPWTILTTERCVIRELELDDLEDLFCLYQGKGMTDYMEPLYAFEEEMEYQKSYISYMYRYFGYGMWLVFEKETNQLIGRAGVEHREELEGELELGYAIGTPFQGKGYATEVCKAIIQYVHEEMEFTRLNCLMEKENQASVHLAKKLGFSFLKEMDLGGKKMQRYLLTWNEKENF